MKKKTNKVSSGVVMDVLLTLTEKELIFLMLSNPHSLNELCIMATLENQMIEEEKLDFYSL
jgi:hypothetical protein